MDIRRGLGAAAGATLLAVAACASFGADVPDVANDGGPDGASDAVAVPPLDAGGCVGTTLTFDFGDAGGLTTKGAPPTLTSAAGNPPPSLEGTYTSGTAGAYAEIPLSATSSWCLHVELDVAYEGLSGGNVDGPRIRGDGVQLTFQMSPTALSFGDNGADIPLGAPLASGFHHVVLDLSRTGSTTSLRAAVEARAVVVTPLEQDLGALVAFDVGLTSGGPSSSGTQYIDNVMIVYGPR